jgi:ribosome-binding protein aMBF1 (putative translation factor)
MRWNRRDSAYRPNEVYPHIMADIGKLLREARREVGLNQAELAARAATTQTYVSRVERGVTMPALPTVERLFHAMGLRLRLTVEPVPIGNVSAEAAQGVLVHDARAAC